MLTEVPSEGKHAAGQAPTSPRPAQQQHRQVHQHVLQQQPRRPARPLNAHLHATVLLHLRGRAGRTKPGGLLMRIFVDLLRRGLIPEGLILRAVWCPGCMMEADPTGSYLKKRPLRLRVVRVLTRLTFLSLRRSCALFLKQQQSIPQEHRLGGQATPTP